MSAITVVSIVLINLALIFYSVGVWFERFGKYLKTWHLLCFWIGFAFDVSGTLAMHFISDKGFDLLDLHTLTGQVALWLMLAHAIWASVVVKKGSEKTRENFHRYSLVVWIIWMVPYIGGVFLGMKG